MAIKPPKCKTCGAEEWRHVCGPRAGSAPAELEKLLGDLGVKVVDVTAEVRAELAAEAQPIASAEKPKTDRKEYLRLKAVERRAAEKLGLTVAQYREKMKAEA